MDKVYRVAVVIAGVVDNIIVAKQGYQHPNKDAVLIVLQVQQDDGEGEVIFNGTLPGPGYLWDGADFVKPSLSRDELKRVCKSYRKSALKVGVTLFGKRFGQDDLRPLRDLDAYFQINANATVDFKTGEGFVTLTDRQALKAIAAISAYVQRCFTREKEIIELIDSGTITTEEEIKSAFEDADQKNE